MMPKTAPADEAGTWARSLAFRALLNDGRRVRVRPVVPADRANLAAGLARMSPRSRYFRFHSQVSRLSEARLRYLSEVDFREHVAWAALAIDEPGSPGVGVARFVRDREHPESAEFAVTLLDEWQGFGLGSLLLRTLMGSAAQRGIGQLVAPVLAENEAALHLIERLGGRRARVEDGVVDMILPVRRALRASRPVRPTALLHGRTA
ncbi:MAG: GNAT family N-acetyltransferase [Gemmatimonadota bacterium]|nr:GNAT family N-acetyltransferase [Gemmatimonadota bacterium]